MIGVGIQTGMKHLLFIRKGIVIALPHNFQTTRERMSGSTKNAAMTANASEVATSNYPVIVKVVQKAATPAQVQQKTPAVNARMVSS